MSAEVAVEKDGEESFEDEEEEVEEPASISPGKMAQHAVTGRGVTLTMLIADNIIQAGEGVLSLEYLGQKFTGDLLPSGSIKSVETGTVFGSPSSWAIFCKKLVNPAKKSGCGWASVKYKGKKLDSWKSTWLRQKQLQSPHSPASSTSDSIAGVEGNQSASSLELSGKNTTDDNSVTMETSSSLHSLSELKPREDTKDKIKQELADAYKGMVKENDKVPMETDGGQILDLTKKSSSAKADAVVFSSYGDSLSKRSEPGVCYVEEQEEALNLSLKKSPVAAPKVKPPTPSPVTPKVEVKQEEQLFDSSKDRNPIKHSTLPDRTHTIDPNTLVECERFSDMGKIQPFTVSMSTNSELLLDFHCHLTTSEVVGYLGGKWDHNTQHLSIQQAFPCRCRLGDSQNASVVEEEIRQMMKHLSMSLVGWYHSHPYCRPEPSVKDVDCQIAYQLRMKGAKSNYFPCVGIINSPYYGKSQKTESSIQMYMVMPPPEPIKSDYGIPMHLKYSVKQNQSVSEDLLSEMKKLADFYRGSPDWISFQHSWHPSVSYLDKLKTSLSNKLPEDQMDHGTFLDFVQHILTPKD